MICSLFLVLLNICQLALAVDDSRGPSIKDIRDEFLDPQVALQMGILDGVVYMVNSTYFEPVPPEYKLISWIDEGSTEVLITTKETTDASQVIVTFRGSEEVADWIVNIDQRLVKFGSPDRTIPYDMHLPSDDGGIENIEILAHSGFNQVFKIYDEVVKIIGPLVDNKLYVTGHSLGGANAILFATMYAFTNPNISVYCTTFGQPRPGNLGLKMFIESIWNLNVWRVVNKKDIVPRIPLPFNNFTHSGHLMWKRDSEDSPALAYYRQIGSKRKRFRGIPDFSVALLDAEEIVDYIGDHSMTETIDSWLSDAEKFATTFTTI